MITSHNNNYTVVEGRVQAERRVLALVSALCTCLTGLPAAAPSMRLQTYVSRDMVSCNHISFLVNSAYDVKFQGQIIIYEIFILNVFS